MHTEMINRIGIDRHEHFVVTGSDDKSVRLWDLETGGLKRTLRPPLGEGSLGEVYCVAIAPDGETVAAGGWTGYRSIDAQRIYIFDLNSGAVSKVIQGPDGITRLLGTYVINPGQAVMQSNSHICADPDMDNRETLKGIKLRHARRTYQVEIRQRYLR